MSSSAETFLLDIQARMSGDAISPLKELEKEIAASKAEYQSLAKESAKADAALAKNTESLAAARAAEEKALAAGDTNAAAKAAKDVEKLAAKEGELASKAEKASAALAKQATALDKSATEFAKLKKHEDAAEKSMKRLERITKLGDGLEKLGGPIGWIGGAVKRSAEAFKALREGGLGGLGSTAIAGVAGLTALATAAAAAGLAVGALGLVMLDSRRDTKLTLEAMFQSADAADAISSAFGEITQGTGIASDRLLAITRDLKKAKVAAEDIPTALRAIAVQESALGDSSGTADLIKQLEDGKTSVGALAADMDSKFGAIADQKAIGLTHVIDQIKDRILGLIEGINIEPVLHGIEILVGLFDQSNEGVLALKEVFGDLFGPLGDGLGIFYTIERFILGMELGFLDVAIAVKKVAKALGFDLGSLGEFPDVAAVAEGAGIALGAVVVLVAGYIGIMHYAMRGAIAGVNALVDAFGSARDAIPGALESVGSSITKALDSVSSIGSDIIDGISKGITDGAQKVIDAITGVANDAIAAAKKILGISSPSKVFAGIGEFTSEGFAGGVMAGMPAANDAIDALVYPPVLAARPAANANASGTTIVISAGAIQITIAVNAASDAQGVAQALAQELAPALTHELERLAAQVAA